MSEKTHAEIIAEMRKPHDEICAKCHDEPNKSCPYCGDPNGCNSPEYGQWPGVMTQLADELEAAHKREIANLRKENAKLREALEELVANIEMRSSTFGLNVMVDTKTYLDAKAALATPQHHDAASLQDAPAN